MVAYVSIPASSKPALCPFPSTHWTSVVGAGTARQALGKLLERYLPPMRSYLTVRFRLGEDQAEDLLQSFLADKILDEGIIALADQARGKFRTFLIRALDRFAVSSLRMEGAAKRTPSGGVTFVPDDALERVPAPATADVFNVAWGRRVIELATERMKEECDAGGRPDVWGAFEVRVLLPTLGQTNALPLEGLVSRFGVTPAQASNLVVTAKRMFARCVRTVVATYAVDDDDAEDEIRRLKQILSTARA